AGQSGLRILCWTAVPARLLEQRVVVLFGGLESIGAYDGRARVVAIAVSPCSRCSRTTDGRHADLRIPSLLLDGKAAVATEVARIAPQRAVLVEILRREQIHRQRLDARRRRAVESGADVDDFPIHTDTERTNDGEARQQLIGEQAGRFQMREVLEHRSATSDADGSSALEAGRAASG